MRARNIKPSFFTDEDIVELGPWGRLLFIGLWCAADREGRLHDKPKQLRIQLFPCDDVDVDVLLDELQRRGFVVRYEVDGKRYVEVVNFRKHQHPHVKEGPSTIPAPDLPGACTVQARLIPDSLIPDSLIPEEKLLSTDSVDAPADLEPAPKQKGIPVAQVRDVFEHWKRVMHKNGTTHLDDKRRRAVERGIRLMGVEKAKRACDGCAASDFHMGREEKTSGRKHNDVTLIFRDAEHMERFLEMAEGAGPAVAADKLPIFEQALALYREGKPEEAQAACQGDSDLWLEVMSRV